MHRPRFGVLVLMAATLIATLPAAAQLLEVEKGPESSLSARNGPESGYLGLSVRSLNPDLRRHFGAPSGEGVLIASIAPESPAEAAGLRVGDVLVRLDGRAIDSSGELRRVVRERPGETVTLEVYRDGEPRTLEATLEGRPFAGDRWHRRHPHHHGDPHHGWDDHWAEWGEAWADWGIRFGERWGRFGGQMGERWGERGAEWGELGAEIGALGAQIGIEIAEAFGEMDWDELGYAIDDSIAVLDAVDWDRIGREIERALEEASEELERSLEELEEALDDVDGS